MRGTSDADSIETMTEISQDTPEDTAASIVVYPRKTNKTKELSKDYDAKTLCSSAWKIMR